VYRDTIVLKSNWDLLVGHYERQNNRPARHDYQSLKVQCSDMCGVTQYYAITGAGSYAAVFRAT